MGLRGPSIEVPKKVKELEMKEFEKKSLIEPKNGRIEGEPVGAELWRMWTSEIKPHFSAEKDFLQKYGGEVGYDRKYIARVLEDHRMMEELVWKNGNEGVGQFAKVLAAHLRFKEEFFSEKVRKIVEEEDASPSEIS